jgi:ribosomal protein S4
MLHPGYLLNPGDMFQVDPKRVMTATGKPDRSKPKALKVARPRLYKPDAAKAAKKEAAEGAEEDLDEEAIRKQNLEFFEELKKVAYSASNRYRGRHLQAKDKQYLRKMVKEMKSVLAKAVKPPTTATATDGKTEKGDKKGNWFASKIEAMLDYLSLTPAERQNKSMEQHVNDQTAKPASEEASSDESKSKSNKLVIRSKLWKQLSSQQRKNILNAFQGTGGRKARGNSLPYRPRDWMSPFAFIPRYLEVNHRICAAVYLRHPVARPGLSEVPTPFSPKIAQLAFNWYLRRS